MASILSNIRNTISGRSTTLAIEDSKTKGNDAAVPSIISSTKQMKIALPSMTDDTKSTASNTLSSSSFGLPKTADSDEESEESDEDDLNELVRTQQKNQHMLVSIAFKEKRIAEAKASKATDEVARLEKEREIMIEERNSLLNGLEDLKQVKEMTETVLDKQNDISEKQTILQETVDANAASQTKQMEDGFEATAKSSEMKIVDEKQDALAAEQKKQSESLKLSQETLDKLIIQNETILREIYATKKETQTWRSLFDEFLSVFKTSTETNKARHDELMMLMKSLSADEKDAMMAYFKEEMNKKKSWLKRK